MTAPITEEHITFSVEKEQCEAILAYPDDREPESAVLLLSPHPLLGGDMDNNVVRHIARRAAEDGALTFRFNYRGVGASPLPQNANNNAFEYFSRMEEAQNYHLLLPDASAAWHFLAERAHRLPLRTVVGYSLGAVLAGMLPDLSHNTRLVCISPPNQRVSMAAFSACSCALHFIAGTDDAFCNLTALSAAINAMPRPATLTILPGVDHFFRGTEEELYRSIRSLPPSL